MKILMDIKEKLSSYTISVGDLTYVLCINGQIIQTENPKETLVLNAILDLMDFIDTYRTFFSHAHRTFSNVDQLLGHKKIFSKFEENESTSTSIFYDHNVMRIEINYKKKKKLIKNTNSR